MAKQFQRDAAPLGQTDETRKRDFRLVREGGKKPSERIVFFFSSSVIVTSSPFSSPRGPMPREIFFLFAAKHKTTTVESSTRRLIDPTGSTAACHRATKTEARARMCCRVTREQENLFFFSSCAVKITRERKKIEETKKSREGQSFGINRAKAL